MNIVLIGGMGAGKTTIGQNLAKELSFQFLDLDSYIEEREGKSIPTLFEEGEQVFRDAETRASHAVGEMDGTVISTGGGVVIRPENMVALRKNGWVVYIKRDIETILATANMSRRPLLRDNPHRLHEIMRERKPLYEKYGHWQVENAGSLVDVVEKTKEKAEVVLCENCNH